MSAFLIEGANFFIDVLICRTVFSSLTAGLLAGASLAALAVTAEAGTTRPVRWNTGGAVWTTTSKDFRAFFKSGEINDRALDAGISNSGWTAEEIQEGMTKTYAVDIIGVSRFLYSNDGVKFLKDQTRLWLEPHHGTEAFGRGGALRWSAADSSLPRVSGGNRPGRGRALSGWLATHLIEVIRAFHF